MPSDNRKCQDMDISSRRLNSKNVSLSSEKTDKRTRRVFSRDILSEIRSHIESNSEISQQNSFAFEDLTSEINKLGQITSKKQHVKPEVDVIGNSKTRPANHNMKFAKKTAPKVSDSFPKTPGIVKRTSRRDCFKHETTGEVKNIPLPGEQPPLFQNECSETTVKPPSNRKLVVTVSETQKFIDEKSSFSGRVILKENSNISIVTENPSYISNTEQCNFSTSPVSSCESFESLHEQSSKCQESPEDIIARKVKDSLYESSPVNKGSTLETHHSNDIEEDCVIRRVFMSSKCVNEETFYPNFPTVHFRHHEDRSETPVSSESMSSYDHEKPIEVVGIQNVRSSPPTSEGSWCTPSSYRNRPPGKERPSRSSVRDPHWTYHNRFKSWNHPGGSSSQGRNTTRVLNWREPQEATDQKFLNEMTNASCINEKTHGRNLQVPLPQAPSSDQTRLPHFRRSYEALPQETQFEMTMRRAPSLDSVSIRSPKSGRTTEPAFLYHFSRDTSHHQGPWQQNNSTVSPGLGYNGNFNGPSPIPQHYSYTPPFLPSSLSSCLPRQEADNPLEPNMRGHQLLGDSQLLRFSRQLLGKYSRSSNNMRYLGLCVSGQTIQELHHKIKEKFYPVGEKVVLLIGTNDFLQNHSLDEMTKAWDELIGQLLSGSSRRLLLLTVPPIPRLAGFESHWYKLNKFNDFIKGYATGSDPTDDVRVADISELFVKEDNKCREDCFELMYSESQRTDMIHLNHRGLSLLHNFLVDKDLL